MFYQNITHLMQSFPQSFAGLSSILPFKYMYLFASYAKTHNLLHLVMLSVLQQQRQKELLAATPLER